MSRLDIVQFAKKSLGLHLFDYEEKQLRNYDKSQQWSSHHEWIRPPEKHQRTLNIWKKYQEYKA